MTLKVAKAHHGPNFGAVPEYTQPDVWHALKAHYDLLGISVNTEVGLPLLMRPTQLTLVPAVGDLVRRLAPPPHC